MHQGIKLFKSIYIVLILIVVVFIIFSTWTVNKEFSVMDKEVIEAVLVILLFGLSYVIYYFYKNESEKNKTDLDNLRRHHKTTEDRLDDAFKYIGSLNVQVQEIKTIFSDLKISPENKKELKYIMEFLAKKVLAIINTEWVLFRIISLDDLKILRETNVCRGEAILLKYQIDNNDLVNHPSALKDYKIVATDQTNLNIKVYCVFPKAKMTKEQEIFIKAIANQVEMLFIIFSSQFYKNFDDNQNHGE